MLTLRYAYSLSPDLLRLLVNSSENSLIILFRTDSSPPTGTSSSLLCFSILYHVLRYYNVSLLVCSLLFSLHCSIKAGIFIWYIHLLFSFPIYKQCLAHSWPSINVLCIHKWINDWVNNLCFLHSCSSKFRDKNISPQLLFWS